MIQVYTGEGKGKTTAAVGLAVRAAGAGKKVLFLQVLKNGTSSEIKILKKIPNISVKNFGEGKRIFPDQENQKEKQNVSRALDFVRSKITDCDLVIFDEIITAIWLKLADEKQVKDLAESVPKEKEIVLTGHHASKNIIKMADLVTEMTVKKHYFKKGTPARKGIEF